MRDFVIQFANGDGGVISTARIGSGMAPFENLDGAGFVLFPHYGLRGRRWHWGMQTLALVWQWNPSWGALEASADA